MDTSSPVVPIPLARSWWMPDLTDQLLHQSRCFMSVSITASRLLGLLVQFFHEPLILENSNVLSVTSVSS